MIHFPRTYDEEYTSIAKHQTTLNENAPLDKHGVYIFPGDRILIDSTYFKVVELSEELIEEGLRYGRADYRWFVKCEDRKPYSINRFSASACVNCSENKIRPPLPYFEELKQRAPFLRGQKYVFTSQGCFKKSIQLITD